MIRCTRWRNKNEQLAIVYSC